MKTYILLQRAIKGTGGGQLYSLGKANYMKQKGWNSYIFSGSNYGEFIIEELRQYEQYIIEELKYAPELYSKKQRDRVIKKILDVTCESDEIVIESGELSCALWGEICAEQVGGRHIVFLLTENNDGIDSGYLPFFRFKLERQELAATTERGLRLLFQDNTGEIDYKKCVLRAKYPRVLSKDNCEMIDNIPNEGVIIGSIGRIEKPVALAVANAMSQLAEKNPEKKFTFVFVGSSNNPSDDAKIKELFCDCSNANLVILESIWPLPEKLFKRVHCFVSSGGSARSSYENNIPTISVDVNDLQAIGVLGYTTSNTLYRKNNEKTDLAELIYKVVFTDYLNQYNYTPAPLDDVEKYLQKHIEFINNCSQVRSYYNVLKLHHSKRSKFIIQKVGVFFFHSRYFAIQERIKSFFKPKVRL